MFPVQIVVKIQRKSTKTEKDCLSPFKVKKNQRNSTKQIKKIVVCSFSRSKWAAQSTNLRATSATPRQLTCCQTRLEPVSPQQLPRQLTLIPAASSRRKSAAIRRTSFCSNLWPPSIVTTTATTSSSNIQPWIGRSTTTPVGGCERLTTSTRLIEFFFKVKW